MIGMSGGRQDVEAGFYVEDRCELFTEIKENFRGTIGLPYANRELQA